MIILQSEDPSKSPNLFNYFGGVCEKRLEECVCSSVAGVIGGCKPPNKPPDIGARNRTWVF